MPPRVVLDVDIDLDRARRGVAQLRQDLAALGGPVAGGRYTAEGGAAAPFVQETAPPLQQGAGRPLTDEEYQQAYRRWADQGFPHPSEAEQAAFDRAVKDWHAGTPTADEAQAERRSRIDDEIARIQEDAEYYRDHARTLQQQRLEALRQLEFEGLEETRAVREQIIRQQAEMDRWYIGEQQRLRAEVDEAIRNLDGDRAGQRRLEDEFWRQRGYTVGQSREMGALINDEFQNVGNRQRQLEWEQRSGGGGGGGGRFGRIGDWAGGWNPLSGRGLGGQITANFFGEFFGELMAMATMAFEQEMQEQARAMLDERGAARAQAIRFQDLTGDFGDMFGGLAREAVGAIGDVGTFFAPMFTTDGELRARNFADTMERIAGEIERISGLPASNQVVQLDALIRTAAQEGAGVGNLQALLDALRTGPGRDSAELRTALLTSVGRVDFDTEFDDLRRSAGLVNYIQDRRRRGGIAPAQRGQFAAMSRERSEETFYLTETLPRALQDLGVLSRDWAGSTDEVYAALERIGQDGERYLQAVADAARVSAFETTLELEAREELGIVWQDLNRRGREYYQTVIDQERAQRAAGNEMVGYGQLMAGLTHMTTDLSDMTAEQVLQLFNLRHAIELLPDSKEILINLRIKQLQALPTPTERAVQQAMGMSGAGDLIIGEGGQLVSDTTRQLVNIETGYTPPSDRLPTGGAQQRINPETGVREFKDLQGNWVPMPTGGSGGYDSAAWQSDAGEKFRDRYGDTSNWRIVRVIDGDTIEAFSESTGQTRQFRMHTGSDWVDAPEMNNRGGEEAAAWLRNQFTPGQTVQIGNVQDSSSYNRIVGSISVGGVNISAAAARQFADRDFIGAYRAPGEAGGRRALQNVRARMQRMSASGAHGAGAGLLDREIGKIDDLLGGAYDADAFDAALESADALQAMLIDRLDEQERTTREAAAQAHADAQELIAKQDALNETILRAMLPEAPGYTPTSQLEDLLGEYAGGRDGWNTGRNRRQTDATLDQQINDPDGIYYGMGGAQIPDMASGGRVKARPGGTVVRVGEAGRDEIITPVGTVEDADKVVTGGDHLIVEAIEKLKDVLKDDVRDGYAEALEHLTLRGGVNAAQLDAIRRQGGRTVLIGGRVQPFT